MLHHVISKDVKLARSSGQEKSGDGGEKSKGTKFKGSRVA